MYQDEVWYETRIVGRDILDRFMFFLSKNLELSESYTNHCIRVTVITNLDFAGVEGRHTCTITGHKNVSSLKPYSIKCPEKIKRKMFTELASALDEEKSDQKVPKAVSETCVKPVQVAPVSVDKSPIVLPNPFGIYPPPISLPPPPVREMASIYATIDPTENKVFETFLSSSGVEIPMDRDVVEALELTKEVDLMFAENAIQNQVAVQDLQNVTYVNNQEMCLVPQPEAPGPKAPIMNMSNCQVTVHYNYK